MHAPLDKCIHNTNQKFNDITYDCNTMPFSKRVHCHGWVQECYFVSAATISAYLDQQPLHPVAAIGHFLVEQKPSMLTMPKKDDPTIILLYEIAKRVFEDKATKEDAQQNIITTICIKATSQFNQAMLLLEEDVPDLRAQKAYKGVSWRWTGINGRVTYEIYHYIIIC